MACVWHISSFLLTCEEAGTLKGSNGRDPIISFHEDVHYLHPAFKKPRRTYAGKWTGCNYTLELLSKGTR